MDCADADTLAALVADALPEPERAAIADHAAGCSRCHAMLDALVREPSGETAAPDDVTVDDRAAAAARTLRPGAHIGRYVIEQRLGAGGMGVVYAAVDSELHRRVAVKLLRPDVEDRIGTHGQDRLLREARTLASLSHPNVVTVYDVGTHGDDLFLAMELVDGGSLAAWLRRAPRTPAEIIDRLIEAGRGLAAAHAAGVVHRDVKPDNILVGLDGRARVTDFGLARSAGAAASEPASERAPLGAPSLTRTGALLGTPAYMAPEQLARGEVDARTDQWAYCATLYEALAGVRPFTADDHAARTTEVAAGRLAAPAPGRVVPGWIRPIVARGLRASPAERWPDLAAVVAALERGRQRRARMARTVALAGVLAISGGALGVRLLSRDAEGAAAGPPSPFRTPDPYIWEDPREGCSCPYSACTGSCVSVCTARAFAFEAFVPGIGGNDRQDVLLGASADGEAILYLTGEECATDRLMLARRRGETYAAVDLTDQVDRRQIDLAEGCCTLTADGKAAIMSTADRRGFARVPIEGATLGPPDRREFDGLVPAAPPGTQLDLPVLAHDQRTLFFLVHHPSGATADPVAHTIHAAERADPRAPFPAATRLAGPVQRYDYVSGISADGLSLFVVDEFETRVLVRATTAEPFAGPGGPTSGALPSRLRGWRTLPLADCSRLLTTYTPGGCQAEDIVWMKAIE